MMTAMPSPESDARPGMMRRMMGLMERLMPFDVRGENPRAVQMLWCVEAARDLIRAGPLRRKVGQMRGLSQWPVTSGAYVVGNPRGSVAVCVLTSAALMEPLAHLPGVAIAGSVATPNLGIEKIIRNVTANPRIRFLVLCGKDSVVFHPGQAVCALYADGVDAERRIIGAVGHLPRLGNTLVARIEAFRRQVELIDRKGEENPATLGALVATLVARTPGPFVETHADGPSINTDNWTDTSAAFAVIRPGGKREPLTYDPAGFFVVTLDHAAGRIVLRHYLPDNTPAHEMRGRSAEAMLLGLLREGLVSQMSHAGYLGGELAKAESALRLGLAFRQDQPLRPNTTPRTTATPPLPAPHLPTQVSGWVLVIALSCSVMLPYLLHTPARLPAAWRRVPFLQRLWPHYWLGWGMIGAILIHASLPMGSAGMKGANQPGLYLGSGAWLLVIAEAILGWRLRDPRLRERTAWRRWHFAAIVGTVICTLGHIRCNGTTIQRVTRLSRR